MRHGRMFFSSHKTDKNMGLSVRTLNETINIFIVLQQFCKCNFDGMFFYVWTSRFSHDLSTIAYYGCLLLFLPSYLSTETPRCDENTFSYWQYGHDEFIVCRLIAFSYGNKQICSIFFNRLARIGPENILQLTISYEYRQILNNFLIDIKSNIIEQSKYWRTNSYYEFNKVKMSSRLDYMFNWFDKISLGNLHDKALK